MSKFIERSHLSAMNLKVYFVCALLCLSTLIAPTVAGRKSSSNSRRGGSSSSSSSRVNYPKQQPPQYANPNIAQLSYGGNQPASAVARPQLNSAPPQQPRPSAPVSNDNARPVGWNVDSPAVAANKPQVNANPPYPVNNQPGLGHPAPPPPYSPMPGQGPPPAYSQYPNQNVPNRFNEQPPAYSPNQGPGGFGAPHSNYPQQPQPGSYPGGAYPQPGQYPQQQPGFGPPQGGYPQGAYPGGYNQPPVINNYEQKGSGGSGLQTALLAGVGGLALYGALKPSDTKTIIINNTVVQTPENGTVTGAELATTPVPLAAYPSTGNLAQNTSGVVQSPGSSEMVPLATYPPPSQVSSEPIKLAEPIAASTGLYPSLPSEPITGSGVAIEVTTAVPLAPFPVTINSIVGASSQPQDALSGGSNTTPNPIALASLNSQNNTPPQESAQKSSAHRSFSTIYTAVTCLSIVLPTFSRLFLF